MSVFLQYYIFSTLFFIIFLYVILGFFLKTKIKNIIVFVLTLFILLSGIYLFIFDKSFFNFISGNDFSIISLFSKDPIFTFYNPTIPFFNISLIQIFLVIIFYNLFFVVKGRLLKLSKKTVYLLITCIIIGAIFRLNIPNNIWDTGYRQVGWISENRDIYNIFYKNINIYGISFSEFVNILNPFLDFWKLSRIFILNIFLDLLNIFLIFILSLNFWKKSKIALFNSLLYSTSIPILRFFTGEHNFVFSTNIVMILLIFLFQFHKSKNIVYFVLSILCSLILFYTHNIFILLPLIFVFYLILFFDKKEIKIVFSFKNMIFYFLSIILLIPAIKVKTLGGFYLGEEMSGNLFINIGIFFTNFLEYFYAFVFTPNNPFLNLEINSLFFILLLILGLLFIGKNKEDYKKFLLLLILYLILILPYSLYFLPRFENLSYSYLSDSLTYSSYKNILGFVNLTDVMIKGSPTFFIFILFSGIGLYNILSIIKNIVLKNIYLVFIFVAIILVPILNYDKIVYKFNQQHDFMFFYNNIEKILDKNQNYNIFYDSIWKKLDTNDEMEYNFYQIMDEKKYNYNVLDFDFKNIKENKNVIYIVPATCYTKHYNSNKNLDYKCLINDNKYTDLYFEPLIEKKIKCDTYDGESYCLKDKIKIGIYKLKNKNE